MHIEDHEAISSNLIIDDTYGMGLTFSDGSGNKMVTVQDIEFPRQARLMIESWVDYSPGAKHYYGRILVREPAVRILEISPTEKYHRVGQVCRISGSIDKWKPEASQDTEIILTRPLLLIEAETDRFMYAEAGDPTNVSPQGALSGCGQKKCSSYFSGDIGG